MESAGQHKTHLLWMDSDTTPRQQAHSRAFLDSYAHEAQKAYAKQSDKAAQRTSNMAMRSDGVTLHHVFLTLGPRASASR